MDSSREQLLNWLVRPPGFELPAQAFNAPPSSRDEERVANIGDEVKLYLRDDTELINPVWLRVTERDASGRMVGVISKGNRLEVQGERRLARGKEIEFKERNIVSLVKTSGVLAHGCLEPRSALG
jgi:hypothetical protein